jgi:ubiquinone/menaquinone biosynthesis C-methylase UbiE
MTFFDGHADQYDDEVAQLAFYRYSDEICFGDWLTRHRDAIDTIVDIGGGTGRLALPLARAGKGVISIDISEGMLRRSREKARVAGVAQQILFAMADAGALPLRDAVGDVVVCYGTLHHLPDPEAAIRECARTLKPGGLWYSYDPNASPLRPLFDLLMKLNPLYDDVESPHHVIRPRDLQRWCAAAGIGVRVTFHAYVPPHLFERLSENAGRALLTASDRMFSAVPVINRWAGVVIAEGAKLP